MSLRTKLFLALQLALIAGASFGFVRALRAETIVIERMVPPNASLTYSENGVPVHSSPVPEGRVRVTIEYNGTPIRLGHRRKH